jgi:hypothetical protein
MPERPYEDEAEDDEIEFKPGAPDYELSEAHGYLWEPSEREFPPRWLIIGLTILVVAGLVVPTLIIILRSQD